MDDVLDFQRLPIVGAQMTGASLTKIAELFIVLSNSVSKIMLPFQYKDKTSSAKYNSGWKVKAQS